MFHAFLRWKDKVYNQLFYITDCNRSPNLLSRDACYILGVLKPCYTVENSTDSTDSTHASNKDDLAAKSFLHQTMKESEWKLSNCSNKWSIPKRQLQGSPLQKQDILDIYSDVFHQNREVSRIAIQIPTQTKCKAPLDMHQGKCLYIYKMLSMRKSGIWKHWEFLRRPKT